MTSISTAIWRRYARPATLTSLVFAAGLGLLAISQLALTSTPARAHFWYPKECCNDQDCFRAARVKRQPDGSLRIDVDHFSVIVPPDLEARPSQDNDAHVCVFRDLFGKYHARCVFLPGVG